MRNRFSQQSNGVSIKFSNFAPKFTIKKKSNVTSNSENFARFCRYAVDRLAASGPRHVLQLHLHGHPITHQGPDAGDPRLGLHSLRHDAGLRGVPQRIRVLPHLRRYHPRQDGGSFHCRTLCCRDARRCLCEVVCRQRQLYRQRTRNMVQ